MVGGGAGVCFFLFCAEDDEVTVLRLFDAPRGHRASRGPTPSPPKSTHARGTRYVGTGNMPASCHYPGQQPLSFTSPGSQQTATKSYPQFPDVSGVSQEMPPS